ncbi:MAG: YtxH domain-containing protein [Coriobacteriia bacterium]|nr:YtxH domain-containing protein [Coriobacteriia bacterium]
MRANRLECFLVGLLVGLAGGLLAGLLFAPTSGARTRRRLANEALRVADIARGVAERAERTAEVVGGRVEHYLGRDEEVARRKIREIREGMQRYTRAQASL